MRSYLGALFVSVAVAFSMAACAPRTNRTYFDRWADQTAKRKAEDAAHAKDKDTLKSQAAAGKSTNVRTESASKKSSSPAASSSSVGGTKTSTGSASKSRVIRPDAPKSNEEDEAIY